VVFAHPILPDVKPQEVKARLVALQGVMEVTFGLIDRQSYLGQPCRQELLAMLQDLTVLMQHHTVIRIGDDTGLRVHFGDGFVHPMQGNQGQQGRKTAALRRPCGGGHEVAILENPRLEPGFDLATEARGRLHFGQEGRMTDTVETLGNIHFQCILGPKPNTQKDGFDRIPAGASWAKAIGMWRELGFPCRF
jgi:hypothetical protein